MWRRKNCKKIHATQLDSEAKFEVEIQKAWMITNQFLMEPSLADGKTTKIHQTLQMQHGLKLCTVVNGSKDPLICKEDTGSCLNRLCDAKHSKFWKMWRYLKKGQKVFSWCDHCWGLGSRVKPIFRRSNSSSALLVISFTFALAPLRQFVKYILQ